MDSSYFRRLFRTMPYGLVFAVCLAFGLFGCNGNPDVIRDIREFSQDHFSYVDKSQCERPLVSMTWQKKMDEQYRANFFMPWHQGASRFSKSDVEQAWVKFKNDAQDGKKSSRRRRAWIGKMAANAGLLSYPNASIKAITTGAAHLRHLPAAKAVYFRKVLAGEKSGSFDKLQVSSIAPGTPVYISHVSRDKAWAIVETGYALGWMPLKLLAVVTPGFINRWEEGPHAAVVRDKTPIYDQDRGFLFRASLGSMFPKTAEGEDTVEILVPARGGQGQAEMCKVTLLKETAMTRPVALTPCRLASLANEMTREPYGWGGLRDNRDCSAMIRDLYAPFGIWLPRHSADQASDGGLYVDLSNLSVAEKKKLIIARGGPYLTLLWLKGHIMLYIGSRNGEPLVFHNFWSVRTMSEGGQQGRKIVGHAAITSLYPGREFNGMGPLEGVYERYLRGMILIVPADRMSSSPSGPPPGSPPGTGR
ncbi:MAG: SH3 domain-containing protein [Syntrophales bacterium]